MKLRFLVNWNGYRVKPLILPWISVLKLRHSRKIYSYIFCFSDTQFTNHFCFLNKSNSSNTFWVLGFFCCCWLAVLVYGFSWLSPSTKKSLLFLFLMHKFFPPQKLNKLVNGKYNFAFTWFFDSWLRRSTIKQIILNLQFSWHMETIYLFLATHLNLIE